MNVYTCTDHDGVASVVVADTEEDARALLERELREHGLDGKKPFTLRKINTAVPRAFVFLNGDY